MTSTTLVTRDTSCLYGLICEKWKGVLFTNVEPFKTLAGCGAHCCATNLKKKVTQLGSSSKFNQLINLLTWPRHQVTSPRLYKECPEISPTGGDTD
ncbi:methenyltetrahydrofolate synthase domain-containing protein-like X2 [Biomphalaria glabrata]|nr:methenyltetrahydrofolate synthase domain-containing protein X2 [Biomphalaria glabrata]